VRNHLGAGLRDDLSAADAAGRRTTVKKTKNTAVRFTITSEEVIGGIGNGRYVPSAPTW
jgi:hypothetical protein